MPSCGAVMTCSIFIASRISSGWPLTGPVADRALTTVTVPGIGAVSAPWGAGGCGRSSAGS